MKPPAPRALPYTWDRGKPSAVPGIALNIGGRIIAHLTPAEARALAAKLAELARG